MTPRSILITPLVLFCMIFVIIVYWWGYKSPIIGVDDANIYFVYMRNLAEGHGFVWNTGGERVEGFTSLIWTLFGALAYKVSPAHFNIILLVTNFLLIFYTLRSVLFYSRKLNKAEAERVTATDILIVSLLVLPLGFIEWGVIALMETGLWTFLIVHITLQLCSFYLGDNTFSIRKFCFMIVLLDLTRPESMALGLVFIGVLFIMFFFERGLARALNAMAVPLSVHTLTFTAVILWRLSYFGYPFPNTFYAKVSGSVADNLKSGLQYLFRFFYSYPHAAIVAGLLLLFGIVLAKRFRESAQSISNEEKATAIILTVVFAGLAQPVFTGGDHFLYSRFYQPYLPLMYLAVTTVFFWKEYIGFSFQRRRVPTVVLVIPIVFGVLFFSKFTMFDFLKKRDSVNFNILSDFFIARNGRVLAEKMNETFDNFRYPSLGALATGSIAYSYKGKTIDLLGLNNTTMAHANSLKEGYRNHASFEKEGFWKLSPDMLGTFMGADIVNDTALFVLPENTHKYRSADFTYLCYKGIFDDSDFRDSYVPAIVKNKATDYFIFSYYKKSFLSSLENSGNFFVKVFKRKPVPSGQEPIRSLVSREK